MKEKDRRTYTERETTAFEWGKGRRKSTSLSKEGASLGVWGACEKRWKPEGSLVKRKSRNVSIAGLRGDVQKC